MLIGAQLYTLRNSCKTTDDLRETIKRVADMGYTAVQLSGVCDYDPEWMRELLDECGLIAPLTHFSYSRVMNDTDATIEFHRVFGARYIGIGSIPNFKKSGCDLEKYEQFMAEAIPAAKKIKEAGMKFMYHNHNMEFSGNMNYEAILPAAEASGAKYAFVEQDHCYDDDPFECMKRSYDYLSSLGYN